MNKDNLLFAVVGILIGFLSGYLMEEAMDSRQPPRAIPGQMAAGATGAPTGAMPGLGGPGGPTPDMPGGGGSPMEIMRRLEELQQQLAQNPDNPELVLAVANESFDVANQVPNPAGSRPLWMQARDHYQRYLEMRPQDPNLPNVLSDLGVSHQELGEYDQALAMFRRAREVAPDHWQSLFNQVVVLAFNLKQFDQAQQVLEELRQAQPNNPDIQRLAAAVEEEQRKAS